MKTIFKKMTINAITSLVLFVALASCKEECYDDPVFPKIVTDEIINVPLFVEDENGQLPANDDAKLFEIRKKNPVVDREGKQLTFGEFSTVRGTLTVEGRENGTRVSLDLTGLIPNALYTVWNVTFHEPGFDPSKEENNIRGVGVIGKGDGSESYFRASPSGTGTISAFTPKGLLSMFGDIAAHPFEDEVEWHIVGAYHMDDLSHGPDLGPDGTVVEQFAFVFKPKTQP